jgi:hypothetical protein
VYLFEFVQIDGFVCSRLNFVLAGPFWPVEVVHKHEHSADSPKRNYNAEDATCKVTKMNGLTVFNRKILLLPQTYK